METPHVKQPNKQPTSADPYNFTEAMKTIPNFGQSTSQSEQNPAHNTNTHEQTTVESTEHNLTKDNSGNYNNVDQRLNITSESIHDYMDNRVKENHDLIKNCNKPFLADVYANLMWEFPELRNVKVIDRNIKGNAFFNSVTQTTNGQILPTVNFNFSNTDTYLKPENLKEGETFGLEYVLKTIALKTGAKPSEIMRNENLVTSFIMLHEFGHAIDFRDNFLEPELNELTGDHKGIRALPKAVNADRADRLRDFMTQPIPGHVSSDNYYEKIAPFVNRLRALGIDPNNRQEVCESMKKSYRKMSSESFADTFATDYIMRHYNDFFESADSSTNNPNKVKTHVGEFFKINSDLNLLDLTAGKSVKMTKVNITYDNNRHVQFVPTKPEKINAGFLSEKIAIGKSIRLLKDGDPFTSARFDDSPAVEDVCIRPHMDAQGKVRNDIVIQINNGTSKAYYLTEFTGKEPTEVNVSPSEMTDQLKLKVGSKVMLMKRENFASSTVHLGTILGGRLKKPNYSTNDSPIQMHDSIYLSSTVGEKTGVGDLKDPDFMRGGNTTSVNKVYRKWKSYFVETETSTYEVIPYI